jgi:hypothetical protein
MSHLQMNLVKARKKVAYGKVVLPGKKSSFFLKHMVDSRAKFSEPNRIPSYSFGEDRWGYIRPKGGQSY